jgi:NAD(P)H-flavin reductase
MTVGSIYAPEFGRLAQVQPITELEKLFTIELPQGRSLGHAPGQFVMLSIPGVGEAPISISSSPSRSNGHFELCVRRMGDVTGALHSMGSGALVGIRGPMGHGFPIDEMRGKDVVFAPGGLGLAPLRSLINQVLDERDAFGVVILTGKRPAELLFRDELEVGRPEDIVHVTVDRGRDWGTRYYHPLPEGHHDHDTVAITGPPIMYRFVLMELWEAGSRSLRSTLSLGSG